MDTLAAKNDPLGYLCLVLHAHLPFVRHQECEYFLEENWLFEAITETYIPLLVVLENLAADRVPFRLTMSLTPPLVTMLRDPLLQERYVRHIDRLIELAQKECVRTKGDAAFNRTARMYLDKFTMCRTVFVDISRCDIVKKFKRLQDIGFIEIITCGATHGFLPTMQFNPNAVKAQIEVAVQSYHETFGRNPVGMWLPECGYYNGLEKFLESAGILYFFMDAHGILFAEPRPKYGVFAPVYCKGTHVAAFGRDIESSKSVWSSKEGYPGDSDYREFYRDIGFDLDIDYIRPYIDPIGIRINTGVKYYRITGKIERKEPYDHETALAKAALHAGNFMFNREKQIEYLASIMDRRPVIVAPYDAELFGHWWYEGPDWLNYLIRKVAFEQNSLSLCTASDYLTANPRNQSCSPSFSSWGARGYSEVWLEGSNDWLYRHLHKMEDRMVDAARRHPDAAGISRRALNQMARELLLAQSSDWAFIMKTGTAVQYAVRRSKEHIANFNRLFDDLTGGKIDENFLSLLESHNNIFPNINYRVYA
jgi:1,4-alpha-glucan branching enzyme